MADQHQFLDVIDRDEAERRFRAAIQLQPLGEQTISLADALGRVLSRDVYAPVDVPSFDRSNFDGFAVRAADTHGAEEEQPRVLTLLQESIAAAVTPVSEIKAGAAISIATGGMLPRGADAVVMVEDADVIQGQVHVRRPVASGFGVTFAGTDISRGELTLRKGELLTSRETGVLAAIGSAEVAVWRRPLVGVVSTGDEIIEPGQPMNPGLVYDSNARILSDAVSEVGGQPRILGIVRDDLPRLREIVAEGLRTCDVLILSGGSSKGEGDLSYRVVREYCRPGIVVHGVALKPGKPVCLASHHGKSLAILPGFPTSAVFTFHEFVAPVIRALAGRPPQSTTTVTASMAVKVNSVAGRTEYLLVGLAPDASGERLFAYPMGKGSGSVTSFSRADGFATIARHQEIVEANQEISVQLLGRDLQPADLVVIGSHCVGLDFLLSRLHERGFRAKLLTVGSSAGLEAVKRGECDLAGIHLLDPETQQYNRPFLNNQVQLIEGYHRQQGFIYRVGDARFEGRTIAAAVAQALGDSTCLMMNRNQGSGTRILIDQLLRGRQPPGYAIQSRNHHAVAAAIAQHRADWGVGIRYVADLAGLGFLPLAEERYDFVVSAIRSQRPAVLAFQDLLREESTRAALIKLGCRPVHSAPRDTD